MRFKKKTWVTTCTGITQCVIITLHYKYHDDARENDLVLKIHQYAHFKKMIIVSMSKLKFKCQESPLHNTRCQHICANAVIAPE